METTQSPLASTMASNTLVSRDMTPEVTWSGNHTSQVYSATDKYIAVQLQLYISLILVVMGTIGNVLSFLVLIRRRMRTTAMYNFLLILAVADTVVLWASCFKSWLRGVTGFELLHHSQAACTSVTFLFLSATYLASWLIVLMTIDRFMAIWFPLDRESGRSLRHARMAAIALIFLAFATNIHVFWTFGIFKIEEDPQQLCTWNHDVPFMSHTFEVFKLFLYCFVPFCIVLVMNILIIYRIHKSGSRLRGEMELSVNRQMALEITNGHPRERISYLLLTVSFTWLCLMLPYSLLYYIDVLHDTATLRILCFLLMYTNHSINFCLYCVTGRKFREEFGSLLKTCRCRANDGRQRGSARSTMRTEVNMEAVPLRTVKIQDMNDTAASSKTSLNGTPPKHIELYA